MLLTDEPTTFDKLSFQRYVDVLIPVIVSPDTQTPLTIGIFGPWGSGKSSLLAQISARLGKGDDSPVLRVEFKPWLHRKETSLLLPLVQAIRDELATRGSRFVETVSRLTDCIVRLGAQIFLKTITANAASLDDLDKLEKAWLDRNRQARSELVGLRSHIEALCGSLGERKLLLVIDDLDRCDPIEIVDLLEAVKLFLDVKNLITILAVDKKIVDLGIEARYRKAGFDASQLAGIGADYLEKIVQVPIYLHHLTRTQVDTYLGSFVVDKHVKDQLEVLSPALERNPRKLKRIVNLMNATLRGEFPSQVNALLAKLIVLQVQERELFAGLAADPDVILALEKAYVDHTIDIDYTEYRSRHGQVRQFCERHYRPSGALAVLLSGPPHFALIKDTLESYFAFLPTA